jgi:signal peptidase I
VNEKTRRAVVETVLLVGLAVIIAIVLRAFVAQAFRIPSASMEPYLQCGRPTAGCTGSTSDRVLVNRLAYVFGSPQRGQVVVFKAPPRANDCGSHDAGTTFVKRLIGLPGETVREDDHGFIWVREPREAAWTKLPEPYLTRGARFADSTHFGQTWPVPAGSYFMVGDNRSASCDSREWGAVPRGSLLGPVIFTYWPPGRISYHSSGW